MDEITINFRELVLRVLYRWRVILLSMLIGALLLDGYAVYKGIQRAAAAAAAESATTETLAGRLTSADLDVVDKDGALYLGLWNNYRDIAEYLDNSVLMQLDLSAIPTMETVFLLTFPDPLDSPGQNWKDYTTAVFNGLYARMVDEDLCEKAAEALGLPDTRYVFELFESSSQSALESNLHIQSSTPFVLVRARSQEECEELTGLLRSKLDDAVRELKPIYGEFDCTLISQFSYRRDLRLINTRYDLVNKMNGQRSGANTFGATLSPNQRSYLDSLQHGAEPAPETETAIKAAPAAPSVRYVYPKYVVFGAAFGALVSCLWIFCAFYLSQKLLSAEELEDRYGLTQLGFWKSAGSGKHRSAIDRALRRLSGGTAGPESAEDNLKMLSSRVRIAAARNGWSRLFVTCSESGAETDAVIEKLTADLKGQLENVSGVPALLSSQSAMESMSASDAVILVEQVDVSRHSRIRKELAMIKQAGVPVIGFVSLE